MIHTLNSNYPYFYLCRRFTGLDLKKSSQARQSGSYVRMCLKGWADHTAAA